MKIFKKGIIVIILVLVYTCSSNDDSGSQSNVDNEAPSKPLNLASSNITQTSVDFTWTPATDNVGVTSYSVFRNNTVLTSSTIPSVTINNLSLNTSYTFKVRARDAANNQSEFSNEVTITTEADNSTLQMASGNLEMYIGNIIDSAPGNSGNNYEDPLLSERNLWDTIITDILQESINTAVPNAGSLGYQITEFTDTTSAPNQIFYVLEKKMIGTNFWGTYVFNKTPERANLVIMAPHAKYDTNTGKEAVYCFKDASAKALLINGTHRCNSSLASSCSGTTSACGSNAPFRISDMAHTISSMFQKTTENLFSNVTNSVFVQLHGFAKQPTDPYVIMSNGTREAPVTDYATLIKDALILEDNTLTFRLAHIDQDWNRLIGFTNTQGRLINNSTDFCNTSAITTSGRFIHIEQEKTKLRDDVNGWAKMSNALKSVF
ncbi:fibronectin type III domain-containing protein [Psychroserpens sp. MEBiC05023]